MINHSPLNQLLLLLSAGKELLLCTSLGIDAKHAVNYGHVYMIIGSDLAVHLKRVLFSVL